MASIPTKQTHPIDLYLLSACLAFLSLGGFYGGIAFVTDPTGGSIGMNPSMLNPLPLQDFLLPGLFLLAVYAIGSLIVLAALWRHTAKAWWLSFTLSAVLIGWIAFEVIMMRLIAPITVVLAILGVCMLALTMLPSVRHYYREPNAR